jgi:hypothetical protein
LTSEDFVVDYLMNKKFDSNSLPQPEKDGKCSRSCPYFHYDEMPGWPSAQACYKWNEKMDGKEPYYLTQSICRPAIRSTK